MLGNRYCLYHPILSIYSSRLGHQECFYVPAGDVISIAGPDPSNSQFVEVYWDSKIVKMFRTDIDDRAELVIAQAS